MTLEVVSTPSYAESQRAYARARLRLAGGVSTAFRAHERPVPLFIDRAQGSRVVDLDGNEYVDYVCGFGPVVLGHAHRGVVRAVQQAAAGVQLPGGQHLAEIELAETLCRLVPSFEMVRFSNSGSEAVHGALRTARGATGRSLVVKFLGHYHGWFDGVFAGTGSPRPGPESAGQPESALDDLVVLPWNDSDAIDAIFERRGDEIAAVVMEPIACNGGVIYPRPEYLEHVRAACTAAGSLLVFDEVITGFRLGLAGAQGRVGVKCDLAVVAKAMANGFPISAFGGSRQLMEQVGRNETVHAGSYNGGGTSVAAARATLATLESENPYSELTRKGEALMGALRKAACAAGIPFEVAGPGPVFFAWFAAEPVQSFDDHLRSDQKLYQAFAVELLNRGVRVIPNGRWYLSVAHSDADIETTIAAASDALKAVA